MKLEMLKTVKTSDGKIWRAGLILSEAQGDTLPKELLKEFDLGTGLVRLAPEPERKKEPIKPPEPTVDRIIFKTKTEVKSAKKPELMAYLAGAGVEFASDDTRDKLVEKALEVLEVSLVAGESNDTI